MSLFYNNFAVRRILTDWVIVHSEEAIIVDPVMREDVSAFLRRVAEHEVQRLLPDTGPGIEGCAAPTLRLGIGAGYVYAGTTILDCYLVELLDQPAGIRSFVLVFGDEAMGAIVWKRGEQPFFPAVEFLDEHNDGGSFRQEGVLILKALDLLLAPLIERSYTP